MSNGLYKNIPDHEYMLMLEKLPICCVDVVVMQKNKFLMVHRKEGGIWWVPGGRVRKNESFWDTASRKVQQEVGLKVTVDKKLGSYEWIPSVDGKIEGRLYSQLMSGMHAITTGFLCTVVGNPIVSLDYTSIGYEWLENIKKNWHPLLKNVLTDAGVNYEET